MKVFIAIDDTDNKESIGTGRLARVLAEELERAGLLTGSSVTRHQLLVHQDIPYTSHNSCACIAGNRMNCSVQEIGNWARLFVEKNFHEGANPGLCLMSEGSVPGAFRDFGARAQREVIEVPEAKYLAETSDVFIWCGGETGQGCIGALAGVGLRSSGNDGRYIGLRGIRDIGGTVSVSEIKKNSDIEQVLTAEGKPLDDDELIDTRDWVRPSLLNGRPTLVVRKEGDTWCPAERRKKKK
jgi:hypothetical protein